MAHKVVMQLIDDISGEELVDGDGETVSFALDGQAYTIDLSKKNADVFRGLFMDHIAVAAKVGGRSKAGRGAASKPADGPTAKEVREWARANGHEVPDRGRIPAEAREAYEAAH